MLTLVVEMETAAHHAAELEGILRSLVALAGNEPRTLYYSVQRAEGESGRFMLYECYADRPAWDEHLASAPVAALLRRVEALLQTPFRLTVCESVAATPWPAPATTTAPSPDSSAHADRSRA